LARGWHVSWFLEVVWFFLKPGNSGLFGVSL
jgi:hypothetical protein